MTLSPTRKRKGRRGKEDRKVGSPISERVGLPADHASSGAWCSADRAPGGRESWHLFLYSLSPGAFILGSHTECIPLTATSQMSFFSLMCFPNSFSVTVINSNTPSLKCQSKLHQDLRRTIVHLYALSINLNYQLSHYMPTIKQ